MSTNSCSNVTEIPTIKWFQVEQTRGGQLTDRPERWVPVPGYEGAYEVSDLGRVRSLTRVDASGRKWLGRILRQDISSGYPMVYLRGQSKAKRRTVHRLVLEAFLGPCPPGMCGFHNDGCLDNVALDNLCWITGGANGFGCRSYDREERGPCWSPRGGGGGRTHPLDEFDHREMVELRRHGMTVATIADAMGVGQLAVQKVLAKSLGEALG